MTWLAFQDGSIDLCHDCDGQFSPTGESTALGVAFFAAIPLAAAGIALACSRFPSRWTRSWIARAIHVALIAQGGCLAASLLVVLMVGGMLVEDFDLITALLASPLVLHSALNVGGIVAWRKVAETLPARADLRLGTLR